ncbi:MAG TPA: PLP-dependent aminotransferase family protein [Thermoanaerobaculia bacterium]|nr:PLP-dependent aminotransferase family protein [Thermoanaerobaculia bacterium]
MPKQTTHLPLILPLILPPRGPGQPAARWLVAGVRAAILEGRLRPGARLPSTRDLARHHVLSRGTVVSAFEQLAAEGYVEARVGSGTRVTAVLPDSLLEVADPAMATAATAATAAEATAARPPAARRPPRRLSDYGRRVRPFPEPRIVPVRAFRTDLPALDLFPTTLWAQVASRRLRRASANLLLGCGAMGYRPLQEAVAGYLTASRGSRCVPGQIAIVSGVQEALDLAARLLLNPGDRVAIEDPGYLGADLVFAALGAAVVPVGLDDEGMTVGESALAGTRLVYVTPAHQFPTGVSMSLPRRLALLECARRSGALIFEDDYDGEYRYSGRPLPALQGLDRHGQVLFAGSFSKVLFPSLRLGYLVVPEDLVDTVAAAQSVTNRHAPLLEQAVLADFIAGGHFARHVRRMRQVYAERLSVLLECAAERLAGLLEISGVEAGLQTVGWLRAGIDGEAAARAAARRHVEVTPLSRYRRGAAAREGLQLGFAAVDPPEIRRGVGDLAAALAEKAGAT